MIDYPRPITSSCARWLLAIAIGLTCSVEALATELTGIRTGARDQGTRVVLDFDAASDYQVFSLRAPDRVVIDFARASAPPGLTSSVGPQGLLRGVRYAHRGRDGLRVVLDVEPDVAVRHMRLGPNGSTGGSARSRVVIDLARDLEAPDEPQDSIMIVKTGAATQSGAKTTPRSTAQHTPENLAIAQNQTAKVAAEGDITSPRPAPGELLDLNEDGDFMVRSMASIKAGLAAGDAMMDRLRENVSLDVSGELGFEGRVFFQDPIYNTQPGENISISFEPEIYLTWDEEVQSLLFVPFVRWDQHDSRRTHGDIRELSYIYAARDWELRAGIRKVFWGVAESYHLVDIINQTDFVENIDFEDKLGQPMVNLALVRDWGTIDFFVLPGFRERTFPGRDGRFQGPLRISDDALYESSAETNHVDYAVRYSHYFGAFDVGLYHFWGTTREPLFQVGFKDSGEPVLFPFYNVIHQTGLDVQATLGNWALKFEALRRQGQGDTFVAAVGGFEYTFVGVFDTILDVGVLGEYLWDERGKDTPMPFNDDIFVGSRLAFNDAADSQILGGVVSDLNGGGHFLNIEASRRLGDDWKVEVELRMLLGVQPSNPLFSFRRDDHVQIELLRSF